MTAYYVNEDKPTNKATILGGVVMGLLRFVEAMSGVATPI
jgi:hypothetical protein